MVSLAHKVWLFAQSGVRFLRYVEEGKTAQTGSTSSLTIEGLALSALSRLMSSRDGSARLCHLQSQLTAILKILKFGPA